MLNNRVKALKPNIGMEEGKAHKDGHTYTVHYSFTIMPRTYTGEKIPSLALLRNRTPQMQTVGVDPHPQYLETHVQLKQD